MATVVDDRTLRPSERVDVRLDGQDWRIVYGEASLKAPRALQTHFLAFRAGLALLMWAILANEVRGGVAYFFLYATNWCLVWQTLYQTAALYTTHRARAAAPAAAPEPWFAQLTWALHAPVPALTILVTALYWSIVYAGQGLAFSNVMTHGGNALVAFADLWASNQPFYLAHLTAPLLFVAGYGLFSYAYYAAGGLGPDGNAYIYESLDWSNPTPALRLLLISLLALPIVHWLYFVCILRLRRRREVRDAADRL